VGGRIKSEKINGSWIEHGAQWIHGGNYTNPLWKFAKDNEVTFFPGQFV
jgi:hypothetical protein